MSNYVASLSSEHERVDVLRSLGVLDVGEGGFFDDVAKGVCKICGSSMAMVNFFADDYVFAKALYGLSCARSTPRTESICQFTILSDEILEVQDTIADDRFCSLGVVRNSPQIRFYAGVPIRLEPGVRVGTICALSTSTSSLTEDQRWQLLCLARLAELHLSEIRIRFDSREDSSYLDRLESSNASMRTLLDHVPARLSYWDKDLKNRLANRPYEIMFSDRARSISGMHLREFVDGEGPGLYSRLEPFVDGVLRGVRQDFEFEYVSRGKLVQEQVSYVPDLASTGEVVGFYVLSYDIGDRKSMQASLARQNEKLRVTLQSIGDAVITTDTDGRIEFLNPVAERLTGFSLDSAVGMAASRVLRLIDESTRLPLVDPISTCLQENRVIALSGVPALVSRNGDEIGIEQSSAPIHDLSGRAIGAITVFHDVSAQRLLGSQIRHQATHDPLTGLMNRIEFETRLDRVFNSARDLGFKHSLLFIDLDDFKAVNDACGHAVGDVFLQRIAGLMERCVRVGDSLARMGGDEFAVILEQCSKESALNVAEKIRERIDEFRFAHGHRRFRVGASIGLVPIDAMWSEMGQVLEAADAACYEAKQEGRNRIKSFEGPTDRAAAHKRESNWASRIEKALSHQSLELLAQSIVRVDGVRDALRCEALLRLGSGQHSQPLPSGFQASLERSHLASRVDRWVIQEVLRQLESSHQLFQDGGFVSVNVSGQSLRDREFHSHVEELLAGLHFDTSILCFEISEATSLSDQDDVFAFIKRVKRFRTRFAIGSFGSGPSSFGHLRGIPFDYLKIDGQLTRNMWSDPVDHITVKSIVDVARVLGRKTIAERVEHENVFGALDGTGVDFAQGFLLHRPEALSTFLGRPRS